ncbi:MAG: class I adenylate cyclase [Candidatus Anaerobiospirillum merdipullorum]|uniref:Class I adenylate cyclase n=1 Tax=Candidatus Anaerobiospirillum merdipullorum TaxID=2838450 RepID=A0A9E2KPU3_9GAMM|nr:class I adenylate cyclase [Candidatus Anaerobiospirillum merdipullorum]
MAVSATALYAARLRRYDTVNAQRVAYAFSLASPDARRFLALLPLLLHYNCKGIPGFRASGVPCGIDGFIPDKEQTKYLRRVCDGKLPPEPEEHSILALYGMGSTASIGQGSHSDFDIWVCVGRNLDGEHMAALNEKCNFICTFAQGLGVDLNLFVTPEDRFVSERMRGVTGDNCGSAQNLFLLDEFYRSAVRICGRHLCWYLISPQDELSDYQAALRAVKASGVLPPEELFDFGSVANSSPAEYFGSGLWLLYKGIEYPFKAALKILLMEVYADEYPQSFLLSLEMKRQLFSSDGNYDLHLDPYYLMYRKVHAYLVREGDLKRLELLRKCFYLKIFLGLKDLPSEEAVRFRRTLLDKLAVAWQWSAEVKEELENRAWWKIHYVRTFYADLFAALIKSYRALLSFSVRHGIEYAITSDDAGVLSRKLYAAYDKYDSKIILFPPDFTYSLHEASLSFIKTHQDSLCPQGWHLYTVSIHSLEILSTKSAYMATSLIEGITWACFNQLLTKRTQINVAGDVQDVSAEKIARLADDLGRVLSSPVRAQVPDQTFLRPREVKACAVVLNLEHDVTLEHSVNSLDINVGSTLCAGRQKRCLIGSVSLITVNSWGEITASDLPDGEAGVVELLATLLRVSKNSEGDDLKKVLSSIEVLCYAKFHADLIRYDLQAIIRQVFACAEEKAASLRSYTFEVGHNSYIARHVRDRGVYIMRHNMLGDENDSFGVHTRFGMRPEFSLQVPPQVDRYSNVGIMQYFFAPLADGWDIYIVNEDNEVQIYPHYVGSRAALVNAINRYYTKLSEESRQGGARFNLPQYFVLSPDLQVIHPFTIREQSQVD